MKEKYILVECDIDGQGKQWRIARIVEAGQLYRFDSLNFEDPVELFEDCRKVGPFDPASLADRFTETVWGGPSNTVEYMEWVQAGRPDFDAWTKNKWR